MYHASSERISKAGSGSKTPKYGGARSSGSGLRNRSAGGDGASSSSGAFLGMDDSSGSDIDEGRVRDAEKLFESEVLRGLNMWLDRLLEGTQQKFRVAGWPDMVADNCDNS